MRFSFPLFDFFYDDLPQDATICMLVQVCDLRCYGCQCLKNKIADHEFPVIWTSAHVDGSKEQFWNTLDEGWIDCMLFDLLPLKFFLMKNPSRHA